MSETPALVVDVSLARSMVEPLYRDLTLPTGENVMQHADGIASILREVRDDPELISAAYLFCVPSVIQNSGEWIEKSFGPAVNGLVQELGQVNELSRRARSENEEANTRHQVEAMRRMFLSMCKDLRVVLLKLASRLQTLRWFAASKREGAEKFGTETLDLYAPLANRLGIWQLKWELEDLSLRFTRPSEYREIAQQLDESREQRIEFMQSAVLRIRGLLEENGIKAEVSGRPKHIYSIWKKMQRKHLRFDQLFDVRAVRIIVDTVERCYQVLSIVHENFPVISKEYDDYIAKPKPNGYQSLHTVVTDKAGRPLEIQIRTRAMHEFAELGVAAHWRYKEAGNSNGATSAEEQRVAWLRQLLAWGSDMQNQGQPEGEAVLDDHIYALTPQGRVVELPRGGTPVDFAYAVHTQLGHRTKGAKVDGVLVPLNTKLETGQTVEIIAAKVGRRPATGSPPRRALRPVRAPATRSASGSTPSRLRSSPPRAARRSTRSLRASARLRSSSRISPSASAMRASTNSALHTARRRSRRRRSPPPCSRPSPPRPSPTRSSSASPATRARATCSSWASTRSSRSSLAAAIPCRPTRSSATSPAAAA